jgi:hypothetical protein
LSLHELAPEALLARWLGAHASAVASVIYSEPISVPYEQLASIDGWVVWLGHPPVPDGLSLLPASESLLWNEPETAVATGLLVAADYAIRRGAGDTETARALLRRESPVAFVVPDGIRGPGADVLESAKNAGVAVVQGRIETASEIAGVAEAFGRRHAAHAISLGRLHDPALSFQSRIPNLTIGDNAASSFIVHDQPERDGVTVNGEMSEQFAIEIGVSAPDLAPDAWPELERLAATIPSFLDGLSSYLELDALEISWQEGREPDPDVLGEVVRVWLKALIDATMVDVRIGFAPSGGSTVLLAEMHERASEFRRRRNELEFGASQLSGE